MLTKSKGSTGDGSAAAATATSKASSSVGAYRLVEASTILAAVINMPSGSAFVPGAVPVASPPLATTPAAAPASSPALVSGDVYGEAASNLVAGNVLEETVQQILDMGGGTWDRGTVIRALRAAFNNPERAVEYLYSGIPEQPDVLPTESAGAAQPNNAPSVPQQPVTVLSSGPKANPLNLFPEGVPNVGSDGAAAGALDFVRASEQGRGSIEW